jgi:RNA ligase (TIGR02306 family)
LVPKDTLANGCEVITEYLGITKYEAPEIFCKTGSSSNLPEGLHKYDIEGADRYLSIIQSLYDSKVLITEKLEGTNFSVHINSENVFVNSRTRTIREYDDNTYWSVAKKQNVIDFAKHLVSKWKKPVTIYGEMIGPNIQKNIYKKAHHEVFFFDISIGFQWLNPEQFIGEISEFYVNPYTRIVPILHIGILSDWLKNKTVKEASNGESIMTKGVRREGIVLRPWIETHSEIGRLILKQRSPEYLSRSEF